MKLKRVYFFFFFLFVGFILFSENNLSSQLLKKYLYKNNLQNKGWIERLYIYDLDDDGRKDFLVVEAGRKRISALNLEGKKLWVFTGGVVEKIFIAGKRLYQLVTKKEGSNLVVFLLDKTGKIIFKKKLLTSDFLSSGEKYRIYLVDIDYDSLPELIFASPYGEKIKIFTLTGEEISKKQSLVYLPDVFSDSYKWERKFFVAKIYEQNDNEYRYPVLKDALSPYRLKVAREFKKQWIDFYYEGKKKRRFYFSKINLPSVKLNPYFTSVAIDDLFSEEKGYEIILGGRNRIYILNANFELLKVIENVFY